MHACHKHLMDREANTACQGAYRSIFGPVKTSQFVFLPSPAYGEPTGHGNVNQECLGEVWHQMQNERAKTFCFRLQSCHTPDFLLWLQGKSQIGSLIPFSMLCACHCSLCNLMEWQYSSQQPDGELCILIYCMQGLNSWESPESTIFPRYQH